MARSLNKVQLIGRLGADPETKFTATGLQVTTFNLATNRQWTRDGEQHDETDWHSIVAWEKLAQICSDHLSKGRLIYAEGRLHTRSWDNGGQKQYKTEIILADMLILDGKNGSSETSSESQTARSTRDADAEREPAARRSPGRGRSAPGSADDAEELPF